MKNIISKIAYELYKQDWIDTHTNIRQRLDSIVDYYLETDGQYGNSTYDKYIYEVGFNGEIYACYDEFLDNEYQDKEYIIGLLKDTKLIYFYINDIKLEEIEV